MKKVTVVSPANIAFIKYWGHTGGEEYLPLNTSISMTLSGCQTTTTVEVSEHYKSDLIEIQSGNGAYIPLNTDTLKGRKAYEQINRIRKLAHSNHFARIKTHNSFPTDAGIASSASGFSALTTALLITYGLEEIVADKSELSRQIRLCGSGSATRSVYGGFVELLHGRSHDECIARQIADEHHWPLVDLISVVNTGKKDISSSEGHAIAESSPYFETRLKEMQGRITTTREAIIEKNLRNLGPCIEADTISMHAVMMTSRPPAYYWEPGTIAVLKEVISIRKRGLQGYFSIDAGANVHVICEKKDAAQVQKILEQNSHVLQVLYNEPTEGVHEVNDHLF